MRLRTLRALLVTIVLSMPLMTLSLDVSAADHGHDHGPAETASKSSPRKEGKRVKSVPVEATEEHGVDGPVIKTRKVQSSPAPGMHHDEAAPAHGDMHAKAADTHDDGHGGGHSSPKAPASEKAALAANAHAADHGSDGVAAETSLRWLQNGNTRYLKRNLRADGKGAADRKRLSSGQKPHAIVLSCSDSRVPPEIVFDQALGEIFVIRVAGEALDASVVASIEYAVAHLGSKLIVVMGHSQCGAVKAALGAKEGESAGSEDLDKLVADIRPRLKTVLKDKPSTNFEVESAVNADGVARDLVKRSDIIRKKVEAGDLVIKTALYRLETGKVSFY